MRRDKKLSEYVFAVSIDAAYVGVTNSMRAFEIIYRHYH
jgi:hypothetical protein